MSAIALLSYRYDLIGIEIESSVLRTCGEILSWRNLGGASFHGELKYGEKTQYIW